MKTITTQTKACTSFAYMPLVQPYVARVYPLTVTAVTYDDGSLALKVIDNGDRSKNATRAINDGHDLADIAITRSHAAKYRLNSKLDGGVYFDRVFDLLQNAG